VLSSALDRPRQLLEDIVGLLQDDIQLLPEDVEPKEQFV